MIKCFFHRITLSAMVGGGGGGGGGNSIGFGPIKWEAQLRGPFNMGW